MSITIQTKNIIPKAFLYCMALQPLTALLWQQQISFFKLNWILYPIIMTAVALSIGIRRKAPNAFYALIMVFFLYSIYFLGRPTDWEGVFRIFITLLPLAFIRTLQQVQSAAMSRTFWILYLSSICVPLIISYLQYAGRFPYYEFDVDEVGQFGRISGGYNKPNNFVAFLFPLYLFGFYLWRIRRKKLEGILVIAFVLAIVYATGLRTAVFIFGLIFLASFYSRQTGLIVYGYYRNYVNFFIAIAAMAILYIFYHNFGIVDGLRGRIPMWLAHAETVFRSPLPEILTGKGRVLLGDEYKDVLLVGSRIEAHNNTFRTILVFGFIGYLLYCTFIRYVITTVYSEVEPSNVKFLRMACFLFLLLYSITNEPAYYSSIMWSVMIGVFPVWGKATDAIPKASFQIS